MTCKTRVPILAALVVLLCAAVPGHAADYDSSQFLNDYGAYDAQAKDTAQGHFTSALRSIDRKLATDPHNGLFHARRGQVFLDTGRFQEAVGEFRVVEAMHPGESLPHALLGVSLLLAGDTEGAIAEYVKALQLPHRTGVDGIYGELSLALEKHGEADNAITTLESATKATNPKNVWIMLTLRCIVGEEIDLADAAQESCDEAIADDKADPAALKGRGLLYLKEKQYAKAVSDFTGALSLQPKNPIDLYGRGLARRALGRQAQAAADMTLAAEQEPGIAGIMARLHAGSS